RTGDGRLHELDVLVLATGFKTHAFMRPMSVVGRDGETLADAWAERPSAYMSIAIPGFPNFFMLNGPNGPVGNFSLIEVAELQFDYIMQLVDRIRSSECHEVSATRLAMEQHEAAREKAVEKTVWVTGCRSWYLDDRGIPATWPWSFDQFRAEMQTPNEAAFEFRWRRRRDSAESLRPSAVSPSVASSASRPAWSASRSPAQSSRGSSSSSRRRASACYSRRGGATISLSPNGTATSSSSPTVAGPPSARLRRGASTPTTSSSTSGS